MLRVLALLISLCCLGGCAAPNSKNELLTATLDSYASTLRWGNVEDAVAFVDPATLKEHPLTELDVQRFRQVRVNSYNAQPTRPLGGNEVGQVVEIVLTNNNTQSVRSVVDRQRWRYDEEKKRWWLVSGLPDITQH